MVEGTVFINVEKVFDQDIHYYLESIVRDTKDIWLWNLEELNFKIVLFIYQEKNCGKLYLFV